MIEIKDEEKQATVAVLGAGINRVVCVKRGEHTATVPYYMVKEAVTKAERSPA